MSDKDEIIAAIKDGFKSAGSSFGSGSGSGSGNITNLIGNMGLLSGTFGTVVTSAKLVASAFQSIAKESEQLITNFQQASDTGVTFTKNLVGFNIAVLQTMMSTEDFVKVINKNKIGFTGLGGGMEESTKAFAQLSKELSQRDFATQLRDLGYDTEGYNELLAISATQFGALNSKMGRLGPEGIDRTLQATRDLGQQLSLVAELTGESRKAQMEEIQKSRENEALQVAYDQLGEGARAAFESMESELKAFGVGDISKAIVAQNGNLTQKQSEQLAVLGAPGIQFRDALLNYTKTMASDAEPAVKEKAKADLRAAEQGINELTKTKEFQDRVRYQQFYTDAGSQVGEFSSKVSAANRNINEAIRAEQSKEGGDKNANATSIIQAYTKKVEKDEEQRKNETEDQKKERKAQEELSKDMLRGQQILNQQSTILLGELLKLGANKLGSEALKYDISSKLNQQKPDGSPNTFNPDNIQRKTEEIFNAITDAVGKTMPAGFVKGLENATDIIAKYGKSAFDWASDKLTGNVKPHATGTMGVWGELFHDFNTNGELHQLDGREAVVTEAQFSNIINSVAGTAMNISSDIQKTNSNTAGAQVNQLNDAHLTDIKQLLGQLNTFMSHLPEIASNTDKQIRALKDLHPDLHA